MELETEVSYSINTDLTDLNQYGYLKPNAYQTLLNRVADMHLVDIGLNVETVMQTGLAWALISMSIEVKKAIKGTQTLCATTWHSGRRGPFFRREFEFKDNSGEIVFIAATFSVLLDLEKRSIYRQKELPFELCDTTDKLVMEATPSFKEKFEFDLVETRNIRPSYIDCLGHVNNCRYGEFAYDAINPAEAQMQNLKRMDIYFLSEMRFGDTFNVEKANRGNRIIIRGANNIKNDISFNVVMEFCE